MGPARRFATLLGGASVGQIRSAIPDSEHVREPAQTHAGAPSLHMRLSKYTEYGCGWELDSAHDKPGSAFVLGVQQGGFTRSRWPCSTCR